ncbi:hypothetical protein MYCTH_73602 [Thermothelomyces thermophilus ATCC 42464]|uniref:Bul1 C-terminal domain-containing protein n=1 Tax=Thermothelomyces thermophilus (strain ATCC 42464 / BCRC 31852 / DSM 1799) TaxID=573729 RepID=G2Q5M8_THET4|nr:uncharacterized protein MYCTH_73602 [Thermothelomyces thermophilus ATCC 42464]AEO55464.1 hypothetical protein MYCTH_73602 [Thermothelomyces thermophilus ATCC 42464]
MGPWVNAASSASSITSPGFASSQAARLAYPKSDISINLKDHSSSKVYTSLSPVAGDVTITTRRDVRFDSIQILLLGHTKTAYEGMGMPQEVTHTFLKMVMPIPESTYPLPRVLEAGRTFKIPFNFVIPSQLTINACNHARHSETIQDHHVKLPPSLGGWQRDDMAPKMAQVVYSIKARVVREDSDCRTRIMEATHPIQVLPATPEEPPLSITDKDRLYRMSKAKYLRKNMLTTKVGCIRAEAVQPGAAVLSPDGRRVMSHPMAHIKLVFAPESPRALPPTITGVTAKLTAYTYFSSGTIHCFPNLGEWITPCCPDRRGQYSSSVALPAVTLAEQPAWTSHPTIPRRDSGYGSSCVEDSDSSDHEDPRTKWDSSRSSSPQAHHTATLAVPLSLPTDRKMLVPTFHSCIASRVYTVQLTVGVAAKGAGSTSLSVVVPLQIAADGEGGKEAARGDRPPSFEEAAADEHLRPRVLRAPPSEEQTREGRESWMLAAGAAGQVADRGGLPEYDDSGRRRRRD